VEKVLRAIHAPFLFGRYRLEKIQGGIFAFRRKNPV